MARHVTDVPDRDRPATYDDLLRVPDHMVAEIVDGALYTWPRPAGPQTRARSRLGGRLDTFQDDGDGVGGWQILDEPELHFGADVVVPDMAAWRIARMPVILDVPFFTLVPDWVCEILSPSTSRLNRGKKLGVYARAGVSYTWHADPIARTLEVLMRDGGGWTTQSIYRADERMRAIPFEAVEIPLPYLWGPPRADASSSETARS